MAKTKSFLLTFSALVAGYAIGAVVLLIRYIWRGGALW